MAGHSKWAQIKRKKAVVDAKKGKLFSRLARDIEFAVQKGADPDLNPALKSAVAEARMYNMPNENIERAIKKGIGAEAEAGTLEEIYYGAYGPGGIAILIKAVTANKNRTTAQLKHILSVHNSTFTESASVLWQFQKTPDGWSARSRISLSPTDRERLNMLIGALRSETGIQGIFTNAQ